MRFAAFVLAVLAVSGAAWAAEHPGRYLAEARGRVFLSDAHLARVRGWRDKDKCESSFELVAEGAVTLRWTIDWRRVRNVQVSTRRHFITDVEESAYQQQPGIILYGASAASVRLPDGTPRMEDNMEFFLKDVSKMDYALKAIRDQMAAC